MACEAVPEPEAPESSPPTPAGLVRWRRATLLTLLIGYSGYYVCRSNLSVTTPLLLDEFGPAGITKAHIGAIASLGVLLYAIGKITNGLAADWLGGRTVFLLGAFVSVGCTIAFGLIPGVTAFGLLYVIWAVNRYFQSMGWGGLMNVSARWYPLGSHATVMGILSMSYLAGDAVVRWFLGTAIKGGLGWRGVFFLSAGVLGAIAVVSLFTLKRSPSDVGFDEPEANPDNVYGESGNQGARGLTGPNGVLALLRPALVSPVFWAVAATNFGLTLIRETFNTWTPTYLHEWGGLPAGHAAVSSLGFPLVGALAAAGAGYLGDRLGGRHERIVVPSIAVLTVALAATALLPAQGQWQLSLLLICVVGVFLLAPYSFISGVMALDFGGKRGAATVAGLFDSAGYFGGVVAGWGVGQLAESHGWRAAFLGLAGVAAAALVAAILYALASRGRRRRAVL